MEDNNCDITIKVKVQLIMDKGYWIDYCRKHGINEWAVNEGCINPNEKLEMSIEDAVKWKIIDIDKIKEQGESYF